MHFMCGMRTTKDGGGFGWNSNDDDDDDENDCKSSQTHTHAAAAGLKKKTHCESERKCNCSFVGVLKNRVNIHIDISQLNFVVPKAMWMVEFMLGKFKKS